MVQKIGPEEQNVILKFGGGLHTRASPDEIDGRESAGGFNFLIDIQNRNLRNRPPFDLVGTVPNAAAVRGGASLLKTDGTVTTLFQAGNTVYQWDGHSTFTSKGSCSATCQLRGHWRTHVWNLTDRVIITDLNLVDPVYQWDGTTFSTVTFTDQAGNPFGTFLARYCSVQTERAIFANVFSGIATPHLIVGAKRSDFTTITIVNRPSNSLGAGDPFFLLTPDLKPINGYLVTYLGTMLSSERGEIFGLTGTDSTNFAFSTFYANSSASGAESIAEIGTDFIYGRPGRIESVRDTNTYGNSEADDLTAIVADVVGTYPGWTIVFNSRTRKAYCFPSGVSEVWVLDVAIRDSGELGGQGSLSPWMRWTTSHSMAFRPTMVMSMLDPVDGLEYIFMGDSAGNIYRMEGKGAAGDGGTSTIDTQFLSKLISSRLDSKAYDVEGYVKYGQQQTSSTLTLTFQYQGENIFNQSLTTTLAAAAAGHYWSGAGSYWNSGIGWNQISGKMTRNKINIPGHDNEFQLLVEVIGNNNFSINEIGLRFRAASS
jgi:hypothetical protein